MYILLNFLLHYSNISQAKYYIFKSFVCDQVTKLDTDCLGAQVLKLLVNLNFSISIIDILCSFIDCVCRRGNGPLG
jgi:hypothetical protein